LADFEPPQDREGRTRHFYTIKENYDNDMNAYKPFESGRLCTVAHRSNCFHFGQRYDRESLVIFVPAKNIAYFLGMLFISWHHDYLTFGAMNFLFDQNLALISLSCIPQ